MSELKTAIGILGCSVGFTALAFLIIGIIGLIVEGVSGSGGDADKGEEKHPESKAE